MTPRKSGGEVRQKQDEIGATPNDVCAEARISTTTLYKIYRDDPTVHRDTRARVWEALERLAAKARAAG